MASTIVVDILADTRSLVRGVNETNAKLNSLNSSAKRITSSISGVFAAFGIGVGINFFKDAFKGAAEEEKTFAALAKAYGDDYTKIFSKIQDLSKRFYVDDGALAKLFLGLKGVLKAESDSLVEGLAKATINLSFLVDKPLQEVQAQLVKFLKDGKLTAKELQSLGLDLTVEQQKSFDRAKKAGEELQWVIDFLTSPENNKKVLDMQTPWVKFLFIMGELKDAIGDKILKRFNDLYYFFTDPDPVNGVDKTNENFRILKDVVVAVTIAITALIVVMKVTALIAAVGAAAKEGATGIALLNVAMGASPWGLIAIAIGLVVAGLVIAYNKFDGFKTVVDTVWNVLKTTFNWVKDNWPMILGALTGPIGLAITAFATNFGNIRGIIVNALGGLGSVFSNFVNDFYQFGRNVIQGMIGGINSMITQAVNSVRNVGSAVANALKGFLGINSPSKLFAGLGSGIIEGLVLGIDKASYLAVNSISDLASSLNSVPMDVSMGMAYSTGSGTKYGVTNNITINAGLGTDSYELGRVVSAAMKKYSGINGNG